MWELFRFFVTKFLYLALHLDAGSFPRPLTAPEERAAFLALAAGDTAARDKLIRHNLRLVAHIAKKYFASSADQEDLVSIGTIGLIKAVNTFDYTRNARFSTYASRCVENEIRMHLRRQRREPDTLSLQDSIESSREGGALSVQDAIPDETNMERDWEHADELVRLKILVDRLPARERQIVLLRYGLAGQSPLTQQQVAAALGLSRSYISRLETRALDTLRIAMDA